MVSLEGSESRVKPEVSVGGSVVVWWIETSGGRVRVGGESLEVGTREGARWQTRGLRGDHSRGKGYVETTAKESLPAPRQSGAREHQLTERASTR